MRHRAERGLNQHAIMCKQLVFVQNLVDHLLRGAYQQRAAQLTLRVKLPACGRRPAAITADAPHRCQIWWEGKISGRLRRIGDESVRVDADLADRRIVPRTLEAVSVVLYEGHKTLWCAADNGQRKGNAECCRAHDAFWCTAHRDPHR